MAGLKRRLAIMELAVTLDVVSYSQQACVMSAKEVAESAFNKSERREAEMNSALQQERAKHDAAVKNMHRLRLLRLQRGVQKTDRAGVSE
jgi:predicted negative regulator of RcsB-dependent stress response